MASRPRTAKRVAAALASLVTVGALTLLLAACNRPEPVRQTVVEEPVRQVRVVTAELGTLEADKSVSATIQARQDSRVAAGANGRVAAVLVREGTRVETGTPVVRLDDAQLRNQLRSAELALEQARVNLVKAERAAGESTSQLDAQLTAAETSDALARQRLDEGRALFAVGGIAATDLAALEANAQQSAAALQQARDALARSRRAADEDLALLELQRSQAATQLAQARDALAETEITAPFDGEVAELYVSEGEFVGAGSPAFRLVSSGDPLASFSVPPEDALLLESQGLVYIRYAGLDYAAQITRSTRSAQQPRLVTLSAELYPAERPIPNGSVAPLRYRVPLADAVLVPSAALSAEQGGTVVYLLDAGRALRREVRVLAETGGVAAVEGIEAGERVISPRPLDVRDGVRVRPVAEDAGSDDGGGGG